MRLLIPFLIVTALFAAERKLPPKLEAIARLALASPPEFAADGLLKLVESGEVPDEASKIDLIQQAYDLAGSAHFPVGMRAIGGVTPDSPTGALNQAYTLKLDRVSLESRAVRAMLPLDPLKARQMFAAMRPDLPALKCEDALVYDVAPYYRVLAMVVQSGFTSKERAKEDHVAFLQEYVAQVHNPAQIAPMAAALKAAGLKPTEYAAVVAKFNGVLEGISGDDRSFSAVQNDTSAAMGPEMAASFQKYVDKNTNGEHCKEDAVKIEPFWQSEESKRLLNGSRQLRFGDVTLKVLSAAERSSPEWQLRLVDYEKQIADWSAGSETSETAYYHEKSTVYEGLVELIPPGPEQDKALEAFMGFLTGSNLQSQNPVEWFLPAYSLLERSRSSNNGEAVKVLAAFEASGHPVLALAAALERNLTRTAPAWLSSQ